MKRLNGSGWSNQEGAGYEVSSKGDRRFSALYARLPDGRLIEDAWGQAKGYADGRAAKGRPALTPGFDYWGEYKGLWSQWADANPSLMAELASVSDGQPLVDRFAKTENNQARALAELLAERQWTQPGSGAVIRNGRIESLGADDVFVFGSNRAGRHGAGAAKVAAERFGARSGVGKGLSGQSYALPTADYVASANGRARYPGLPLDAIGESLKQLALDAKALPGKSFYLTRVGQGLSGYSEAEIRPLIEAAGLPANVKPYWQWEQGGAARQGADPLLFGGATNRKRYPGGVNYWGNDHEATGFLSNYAPLPVGVKFGGVEFPSTEQAYVAAKFNDPEVSRFLANLGEGRDRHGNVQQPAAYAYDLGHYAEGRKRGDAAGAWRAAGWQGDIPKPRADWDNAMRLEVMRDLVTQKFKNNPEFADYLLGTGDRLLVEQTGWGDSFFGMTGGPRVAAGERAEYGQLKGENHLGRILMDVRAELGGAPAARMPEQPAAAVNPTGQQTADAVQLGFWDEAKRKAGQAWPYLAAAGGAGLLGYAVADLMADAPPQQGVLIE